jgi:uncharacterized protein (DUF433 family)
MSEKQDYQVATVHITQTPGVCGGRPCVAGRRIRVQDVYIWYDLMGLSADEIAREHDLTLAQVHAALTFAYENIEQIRADVRADDAIVEAFKKDHTSKLKAKLCSE